MVEGNGCLFGDRNKDDIVDVSDITSIKNNPAFFWQEFNGDLVKLNQYIQKMIGNWG